MAGVPSTCMNCVSTFVFLLFKFLPFVFPFRSDFPPVLLTLHNTRSTSLPSQFPSLQYFPSFQFLSFGLAPSRWCSAALKFICRLIPSPAPLRLPCAPWSGGWLEALPCSSVASPRSGGWLASLPLLLCGFATVGWVVGSSDTLSAFAPRPPPHPISHQF